MAAACRRRKVLSYSLTQAMAGCAGPVRQRCGPAGGLDTTQIREWARTKGIEARDRGRVPADLVARIKAATGQQG
jgi:hypothetical protein